MVGVGQKDLEHPAGGESRNTAAPSDGGRRSALLSLAIFDIGGPLAVYYVLRSSGTSAVVALVFSGLLPAVGIGLSVRRRRRVDAVGVVVLVGILLGVVVGLATGSARLVLLDGTVPTAVLAVVCFGSLLTAKPLMFRIALEFMGPDSAQGRDFEDKWQYREFRHAFAVITVVWGAVFLAETIAQVAIIELASISTAKTTSNVMPIIVAAVTMAWTFRYGRSQQARYERRSAPRAGPLGSGSPMAGPSSGPDSFSPE